MKKVIAILTAAVCAGSMVASANILVAGWDDFSSGTTPTTPHQAAGVTATMTTVGFSNSGAEDRGSSSDTTWGSFDGNGTPASAVIVGTGMNLTAHNGETGDTMQITIVNGGATDLNLAAFHMDALAFRPKASRTFTLDVAAGGALTAGNVYTSTAQEITSLGTAPNAAQDQHDEYDIALTGLTDSTLEAGGTVVFDLVFTGGIPGSSGHHLWLDNIAVSAIPEPATLGLVVASAGGLLFIRRRFVI